METRLEVLKLMLDELNVPAEIGTIDDRVRIQKAVYLGQRSGLDLGYRFGWYKKGPYSPALTEDYYSLRNALAADSKPGGALNESVRTQLKRIQPLMVVPEHVALKPEDWLELVASLDYLLKVRHMAAEQAEETIKIEKPRLFPYTSRAREALSTTLSLSAGA